uniref:Retrotransposon gag domain-containing protein n=1 Tax=Nicotiana tabacum TaxID=4097 RepID=A0A1S4A4B4_TOBAC|nr:PREDICTED: uncharacterized protein LOC107793572 [Nicotiana tabacum]
MGLPHEDPQQHILNFLKISDTYITNGVTPDYVRLTLFPFSLLGEAKRWLKAEPANSITSWNNLARKFMARFFPSGKTAKIRSEIVAFKQKAGESLYSAWERFKGILRDYPHHNQMNEVLAHTFIEGLHAEIKIVVDAAAGGQSNPDWQGEMGRHTVQKFVGVLELDVVSALSPQISILTNQVNQMNLSINKQQVQQVQAFCEICGEGHTSDICPANPESGTQNQYRSQAPQQKYRPPQVEQQASPTSHLEDMLKKVMAEQQALSQKVMDEQQALAIIVRNLERQMGQLASAQNTRPSGALPSDTEPNPKAQVNAVTLRNGRALEKVPKKKKNTDHPEGELAPKPVEGNEKDDKGPKSVIETRPPPPFPQRLQKLRDNAAYKTFLDILRQVQINIPLVDILQEVPKYAKYIKDIVANKRRLTEFETVALIEECSSKIQCKLPQILKDLGSFTIQISIGKHAVGRALCDLGASINLMPLSMFRQLGLGEPRPITVILQLADRSPAHLEGVIETCCSQTTGVSSSWDRSLASGFLHIPCRFHYLGL